MSVSPDMNPMQRARSGTVSLPELHTRSLWIPKPRFLSSPTFFCPIFLIAFPHLPLSHPPASLDTIYHPVINVCFHLFSTHLSIHQFPVSTSVCLLVWFFFLVGLFVCSSIVLTLKRITLTKHISLNLLKSCEAFHCHF